MVLYFSLFFFIFGTIIGSFLNVVIFRMNTDKTLGGRSMCMNCGKTLHAHELIPIFSFIFQNGKCTGCKSEISWQYPLIEAVTGFVFLALGMIHLPLFFAYGSAAVISLLFYAVMFAILIVIAGYDLRHKIIPDRPLLVFLLLALFSRIIVFFPTAHFVPFAVSSLLGAVAIAAPFLFLWLISKGKWMGFGDVKLVFAVGILLGGYSALLAIMFAFWIGAIVAVIMLQIKKHKLSMKSEIPFGPFIVLGTFIAFIFGLNIFSFLQLFS